MNVLTPASPPCLSVTKRSSLKKNSLVALLSGIFPLRHFLEKHKRQSFRGTLQRGDQEAGSGACWRSCPASQACTALQRLLQLCGRSSYGPGWVCGDWPCSEWTPTVPCRNKKRKKRNISSEWIYLIDRHCAKIGHLFFSSGETREYLLKVIAAVWRQTPHVMVSFSFGTPYRRLARLKDVCAAIRSMILYVLNTCQCYSAENSTG